MESIKLIIRNLTHTERVRLFVAGSIMILSVIGIVALAIQTSGVMKPVRGGEYTEGVIGQPIFVNPVNATTNVDKDLVAILYAPASDLMNTLEISQDQKQYSLKLKEDLFWSDGERLTSDDVVFTIELIQKLGNESPLYLEWQGVSATRESELQTQITISQPFSFFDQNIKNLRIVPKHIFSSVPPKNLRLSEYNFKPVGSGPYIVDSIEKRKDGFIMKYILSENKYYSGSTPFIPTFSIKFFETFDALLHEMELRTISGFGLSDFVPKEVFDIPRATVETLSMPRYYALFLNPTNNPALQNKETRIALNKAIDKDAIIRDTLKEQGNRLEGPLLREFLGIQKNESPYDPEDAARIIGSQAPLKLTFVVPEIPILEAIAERVRDYWLAAGVSEVSIYPIPISDIQTIIQSRNYDILLFGNSYKNIIDLFPFWHSSFRFSPGLNYSLYKNQAVDSALEEIRQTRVVSQEEINKIIRVDDQIQSDSPAIFLFSAPYFYVHSTRMEGEFPDIIFDPSERFSKISTWSMNRIRIIGNATTTDAEENNK